MDERLQFVARRPAGEAMAELCREFGISRKTGYKIFDRYQDAACRGSRTEAVVRIATPTNFRSRWKTSSCTAVAIQASSDRRRCDRVQYSHKRSFRAALIPVSCFCS
jgi:hypothetical protein